LTDAQARDVLRTRLLPFVVMPGKVLYAAAGDFAFETARNGGHEIIACAHPVDMLAALGEVFGKQILHNASQHLKETKPEYSAARRLTPVQAGTLLGFAIFIVAALWFAPARAATIGAAVFAAIFLAVVAMRLAALLAGVEKPLPRDEMLAGDELPIYTVLVPLFREIGVIDQLLTGLRALNYPPRRLDIKLILEETDTQMRQVVQQLALAPHFDVIIVPDGKPQTKPKALNYALHFARGELVVIFDAEDIPEPNQLLMAARTFALGPDELVCLQARLTYYNANENWLTRQFAIEYAVLFDVVLPFLASWHMPLPLGGTSNHFKMTALRRLGGWDPHNVTEDADLGLRLARFGWRADVLGAATFEEANSQLGNWISQRARWLKGWMQTWFVHMRHPLKTMRQLGLLGFFSMQVIVAGIVVSTLVHPFFLLAIIWDLVFASGSGQSRSWPLMLLTGTGLAVFVSGYVVMMLAGLVALRRRGLQAIGWSILAMPVYWLLMSVGGWLAVKQFITQPFHWNKTRHGLSRFNPRRSRR
jgi:cellulose synthase/poly-beta-1,6-N-acetylglucosamine synthase-like glycosyltransferase